MTDKRSKPMAYDTLLAAGIMDIINIYTKDNIWSGYSLLADELQEKGFRQYSEKELKKYMQILKRQGLIESKPVIGAESNKIYGRGWFACS
jgi:repressor of nif and glnA expression